MQHSLQPQQETTPPDGPRVLGLDDETTPEALSALSAETARRVLSLLYEEPHTPTEIRDAVGTSLQNVHYHLDNLESAGLIREVGTRYSEKGNEMSVYGPASEAVVFMAGDTESQSLLRRALTRIVGALAVLGLASFAVGQLLGGSEQTGSTPETGIMTAEDAASTAGEAAGALDPALVFFVGGLFVLAVLGIWWAYGTYRSLE